jgi:hypothetical protein
MNGTLTKHALRRLWQGALGLALVAAAGTAAAAPGVRTVPACTKVNVPATIDVPAGTTRDGGA